MKLTVLTLGLVLVAGCSGDPTTPVARESPSSDASGAGVFSTESPRALRDRPSHALEPGTYRMSYDASGSPAMLVDVPEGWVEEARWYVVSDDGEEFLGIYSTDAVPRDACDSGTEVAPGPTVDDLVAALVAQRSTRTSRPRRVTLAGQRGVHLVVHGPADLDRCRSAPELVRGRGLYVDGQVDELWVLDVHGTRVVVDVAHGARTPRAEVEELAAMAASMRYTT